MQSLGQDNKIIVLLQIMMIEINMEERGSGDCHGKEKIYVFKTGRSCKLELKHLRDYK